MALVSTVGTADANSYVDATYVDAYMANHPYKTGWTDAATDELYLIYAVIVLDNWVVWHGSRKEEDQLIQALEFPRNLYWEFGNRFDDIIPENIKKAQIEMALHLLKNTEIFDKKELKNIDIGPLEIEFDVNKVETLPSMVKSLVGEFGYIKSGLGGGGIETPLLVRT